jgi:hypothetical protein
VRIFVKKTIILILVLFSVESFGQEEISEPKWKSGARNFITKYLGIDWSNRILGHLPEKLETTPEIPMPEIPKIVKKSTDVESYSKKIKNATDYDKLPAERKRQYDFNFLQELFKVTRRTEAKDEDLSKWMNILDQGGTREGIYQGVVLDEVYFALESIEEKPKDQLLDFYIFFSSNFLKQSLKKQSVEKLNVFSLKRILVEKALDLIEYYETNNLDDLYKWYANYSSAVALKYPNSMNSEVRKNSSAKAHYQWSLDMPIQHLKSEFIIKTHNLMNDLQSFQ